ncbi:hypothetical protein BJ508DRAFT_419056 [Ascobolus immersus RN42]|uniref:Uncharacterized protein n=1 Tax=Ascobolus immersus RN42 TaxID=1160509 RepID=A0A3N4HMU7_ASCIM|nr:hypothetical protein BJ508DRAFT_419056 [Ascobolus immersus RN42]
MNNSFSYASNVWYSDNSYPLQQAYRQSEHELQVGGYELSWEAEDPDVNTEGQRAVHAALHGNSAYYRTATFCSINTGHTPAAMPMQATDGMVYSEPIQLMQHRPERDLDYDLSNASRSHKTTPTAAAQTNSSRIRTETASTHTTIKKSKSTWSRIVSFEDTESEDRIDEACTCTGTASSSKDPPSTTQKESSSTAVKTEDGNKTVTPKTRYTEASPRASVKCINTATCETVSHATEMHRSDTINIPSRHSEASDKTTTPFQTSSQASSAIFKALLQVKSTPCSTSQITAHAKDPTGFPSGPSTIASSSSSSFIGIQASDSAKQINAGNIGNIQEVNNNSSSVQEVKYIYNNCNITQMCTTECHRSGSVSDEPVNEPHCNVFGFFKGL